jgi:hypothetical protein|tara:strand:- start:1172 stop:1381 length:210 start_codon:yes stop_codon:yes gene_type:complete
MFQVGDRVKVIDLAHSVPYYLWGEEATVIDVTASFDDAAYQHTITFEGSETHFALPSDLRKVIEEDNEQ